MLYQLSYASSFPTGNLPRGTEKCADTLQLSAYTAQKSRLAHRRTRSKRGKNQKRVWQRAMPLGPGCPAKPGPTTLHCDLFREATANSTLNFNLK